MTSKSCCLRQHVRGETAAKIKWIDLSLDDDVLKYLLHGSHPSDNDGENDFELLDTDDPVPQSGSSALLCWTDSAYVPV